MQGKPINQTLRIIVDSLKLMCSDTDKSNRLHGADVTVKPDVSVLSLISSHKLNGSGVSAFWLSAIKTQPNLVRLLNVKIRSCIAKYPGLWWCFLI